MIKAAASTDMHMAVDLRREFLSASKDQPSSFGTLPILPPDVGAIRLKPSPKIRKPGVISSP